MTLHSNIIHLRRRNNCTTLQRNSRPLAIPPHIPTVPSVDCGQNEDILENGTQRNHTPHMQNL